MAYSKHKVYSTKSLNVLASSLRKELVYVRRTVAELSSQQVQLYQRLGRVLSDETVRRAAKDKKTALPSEEGSDNDGNLAEDEEILSSEVEQLRNQTVSSSASCQCLETAAGIKALEKKKQLFKHDQQREAYVRVILDRMLWLEQQLNEADQAHSKQHNGDHSAENKELAEMQDRYERFLHTVKDDMEELRNEINLTRKNLSEMRFESGETSLVEDHCCFESEGQQLKDLRCRLDVEKRRSANFELQAKLMSNQHHEDQEKIAELKRQMKIYSQDLEDKKEDCGYLKKQTMRLLKALRTRKHETSESKRDQEDPLPCEEVQPPSRLSRRSFTASSCSSFLDESFLECPGCLAEYPASRYRELMHHLETCIN